MGRMSHTAPPALTEPTDHDVLDLLARLAGLMVAGSYEGTLRIADRLHAVAAAYGRTVDVTVLADGAVLGLGTATRVVAHTPDVPQLAHVSGLKPWLADVSAGHVPLDEARARLDAIAAAPHPWRPWARVLGVVLFCVGFGVSIQPTWQEVWVTAVLGLFVGFALVGGQLAGRSAVLLPLVVSTGVAVAVLVAAEQGWVQGGTIELMIPVLFVFIPGDAITMSMVEVAAGRLTAGAARLVQSAIGLGVLAFGPVVAAGLLGRDPGEIVDTPVAPTFGPVAGWIGWVVFTVGVMLVFGMRAADLPWALAVALLTNGAQLLAVRAFGTLAGTFLAACLLGLVSLWLGRRPNLPPAYVLYLTGFFVLTPGSHGLRGLDAWIGGHPVQGIGDIAGMAALIAAISLGLLAAATILPDPGCRPARSRG